MCFDPISTNFSLSFSQLPEERKIDLLKNLAESSPYTTPQDSRQILPSVVELLKVHFLFGQTVLYG